MTDIWKKDTFAVIFFFFLEWGCCITFKIINFISNWTTKKTKNYLQFGTYFRPFYRAKLQLFPLRTIINTTSRRSYAYLSICEYCIKAHAPVSFSPYLFSIGRLYPSQSHALAWGGDGASPQVTTLCFGIFGARVPFFWFWLPKR